MLNGFVDSEQVGLADCLKCQFFWIMVGFIITGFKISFNRYLGIVINEVLRARKNLQFVIVKIVIFLRESLKVNNFNFNLTSNYFAYFLCTKV